MEELNKTTAMNTTTSDQISSPDDTAHSLSDATLDSVSAGMSKCGPSEIIEPSVPELSLPPVQRQAK